MKNIIRKRTMRQEYYIKGQTTQQVVSIWNQHQIKEGTHLVCDGICLDKWLLVKDLIKLLELIIKDVEEAQTNEFDRGFATALSVFKDWIDDNVLSSDSELNNSTHNKDLTATQQVASPKSKSQRREWKW
jgi:hypothetical protein